MESGIPFSIIHILDDMMIKTVNATYEYKVNNEENSRVKAVDGVSLSINQGDFVVILGKNGSGKSTLARLFNALLIPDQGTVIIDGMETNKNELLWDIRKTLGLVLQNPDNQIVATTVEEDVAFGPENLGIDPDEIRRRVDSSVHMVGMEKFLEHSPHMLSGGQKQRIAIAGVLAMEPKCIVLDEATSMLDPLGRKEVMEVLHALNREKGITIVLITHHMDEAAEADHVFVMQDGRVILEGSPKKIFKNVDAVRKAGLDVPLVTALAAKLNENGISFGELPVNNEEMLTALRNIKMNPHSISGIRMMSPLKSFEENEPSGKSQENDPIIVVNELSHVYMPGTSFERVALNKVNLKIAKGEILGIIGHTGSGKSTLVQHFNGILKPTSGSLCVDGLEATGKELRELRKKVGLIFQYPEHQLFEETVYKDIIFGLQKLGLTQDEMKERVFNAIDILGISPEILDKSPFELSGGQKRRVAIAGVLVMEPKVLILDEPTAGLDPRGSSEVFKLLKKLNRQKGTTIVIISHNMDDIAALCDRVAVMREGELVMVDKTREVFSRTRELKSFGLDIPKMTELFISLSGMGVKSTCPVLTVDEGCEILLNQFSRWAGGEGL